MCFLSSFAQASCFPNIPVIPLTHKYTRPVYNIDASCIMHFNSKWKNASRKYSTHTNTTALLILLYFGRHITLSKSIFLDWFMAP